MGIQEYRVALADLAPEDRPEVEQYLREQLLFVDDDWLATVDNIAAEPPFDAEALDLLTDGALAGSADAAFALARCHFIGMDSVPNPDAGLAWMRVAAERGHSPAMVQMALRHLQETWSAFCRSRRSLGRAACPCPGRRDRDSTRE